MDSFSLGSVLKIVGDFGDGPDTLYVAPGVTADVEAYGGAGDDISAQYLRRRVVAILIAPGSRAARALRDPGREL